MGSPTASLARSSERNATQRSRAEAPSSHNVVCLSGGCAQPAGAGPDAPRGPDLARDDRHLARADLSRAKLEFASLAGVNLTGAILVGAELAGADLTGAQMTGADLRNADVSGAKLRTLIGQQAAKNVDQLVNGDRALRN